MRRYELSDPQWAILEPFFPPTHSGHAGHPWSEHRPIVNGILWILHTGAAWRDLPERYGPFQTVHDRLTRSRHNGAWNRIVEALIRQLEAEEKPIPIRGSLTPPSCARSASGGVAREDPGPLVGGERTHLVQRRIMRWAAGAAVSSTKIDLIIESRGIPLAIGFQPGPEHEDRAETMMLRSTQRQRLGHRNGPANSSPTKATVASGFANAQGSSHPRGHSQEEKRNPGPRL